MWADLLVGELVEMRAEMSDKMKAVTLVDDSVVMKVGYLVEWWVYQMVEMLVWMKAGQLVVWLAGM